MMDAATRTELDRLRLRAYGPDADIDRDPSALRRLVELEEQRLREREARRVASGAAGTTETMPVPPASGRVPAAAGGGRDDAVPAPPGARGTAEREGLPPAASAPRPPAPVAAAKPARPPLSRRAAVALAAVGGAMILAIGGIVLVRALLPPEPEVTVRTVLAPAVRDARAAYSFAWDRDAVPLLHIPLDGSFGRYIDLPTATDVPEFPSTGTVEWAYPLGRYFGWDVWIAGASVDATGLQREHCILIERNDDARGRCVPAQVRAQSALLVSVPFASVGPDDRPVGMAPDERLGFWWYHDRAVTVILGDDR